MKKHLAFILAIIMLISMPLSGCSKKQSGNKEEDKKTIKIATFYSDKDQGSIYKDIAKEFEKNNKDIKVEVVTDFGDEQKIRESLSQKGGYDILGLKRNQVIEFAKSGLLTDISSMVEEKGLNRKLYKISLAYGKYNGKIYGIGDMPMTMEWFYNSDMFKRYKLNEPTNLKELINVCKKLKDRNINPIGLGAIDGWTLPAFFGMITCQTSGINEITTNYGSDYASFKNISGINSAFNIFGGLIGTCIPKNSSDINYKQSVEDFVNGKTAILPAGSWAVDVIDKVKPAGFNYKVFEAGVDLVNQPISLYSATAGQVLVSPANEKNKKEVEKFMDFLLSEDAQKIVTDKGYTSMLISANISENANKKLILNHLDMTDDNSVMLMDNLEPTMLESLTMVLKDILEGRVKPSEGWSRVLKFTFQR